MQKFVSKFATAAHLALLAVAPLLLFLFDAVKLPVAAICSLALLAVMWVLVQPSCRRDESLAEARMRVTEAILHDPLTWVMVALLVLSVIRLLNSGVGVAYNAEAMKWYLRAPVFDELPASATGAGTGFFGASVVLLVVVTGVRHALGRDARLVFGLTASTLAAVFAIIFTLCWLGGWPKAVRESSAALVNAQPLGTAFGFWALLSLASVWGAARSGWRSAEMTAFFALIANVVALAVFAPPLELLIILAALAVYASVIGWRRQVSGLKRAFVRGVVYVVVAMLVVLLLARSVSASLALPGKITALFSLSPLTEGFMAARAFISRAGLESWLEFPWVGSGIGTFGLDLRFHLPPAGWEVVPHGQAAALNGYWFVLAERGVVGAVAFLTPFALLAWDWLRRVLRLGKNAFGSERAMLFPAVMAAVVAMTFFNSSFWRAEVLTAAAAVMALSIASMPIRRAEEQEAEEMKEGAHHGR